MKIIVIYIVYNPQEMFTHGATLPPSEHGHIEKKIIKKSTTMCRAQVKLNSYGYIQNGYIKTQIIFF